MHLLQSHVSRLLVLTAVLGCTCSSQAQPQRRVFGLGEGPWDYETFEQNTLLRVSIVTRGLSHPWAMAFLPGTADANHPTGDVLITETDGRVRLLRDGSLDPEPIADLSPLELDQLFDVSLHPDFSSNGFVYLTYMKEAPRPGESRAESSGQSPATSQGVSQARSAAASEVGSAAASEVGSPAASQVGSPADSGGYWATSAIARGRFDGDRIVEIEEVFAANAWRESRGGHSTRVTFAPDGTLFMSSSHRLDPAAPQRLDTHIGKVLRLNDDGSVPSDNPFVGAAGALPEIYSYGHRTIMDFVVHPETGEMWELENGPHGGDEVNVLRAGANFGWPVVTYGREYDGTRGSPQPWREGMLQPELFWVPSITVSSFTFYTGEAFPAWKNNLFVSAMNMGRLPGTGHIQRIVFNENGEVRREQMLTDLRQRIRYVGQGPDGLLYLLTDETDGVLLRIAPADSKATPSVPDAGGEVSTVSPGQQGAEPLFADFDCSTCHEIDRRAVGPSYRDIAREYAATESNVRLLAGRILEGSVGVWGETPMAPHSGLELDQAKAMVERVLSLR